MIWSFVTNMDIIVSLRFDLLFNSEFLENMGGFIQKDVSLLGKISFRNYFGIGLYEGFIMGYLLGNRL